MDGIIDGKPARDDRGSLIAQQWINVNVNFPYGIISAVGVVVQHCDLQWLILQVLIINLDNKRRRRKEDTRGAEKRVVRDDETECNSATLCNALK